MAGRAAAFVLGAFVWLWAGLALAEPVVVMVPDLPGESFDEELVTAIEVSAQDADAQLQFVRYDAGGFELAGLDARSKRTAGEWAANRVLWVERAKGDFVLFLYEADSDRMLRRRIEIEDGGDVVAVEVLANIAGSVVAESSRGEVVTMTEVPAEELAPKPEPKPEPKPDPKPDPKKREKRKAKTEPKPVRSAPPGFARLWLSVFYAGNTFADAPIWQNGIGLSAAWAPAKQAFVGLRYDVVFPSEFATGTVVFDIRRHPVALFGGYRFQVSPKVDVQLAAKLHVDPVTRRADTDASMALPTADALRIYSGGGASLGLGYRPIPQIRLALDAGFDALFTRAPYGVGIGDPQIVLSPHPARFTLDVGMHFGVLWRARK